MLGAYRWIEELGVAVLAELPEETAFAASHRLAWTIVAAGFFSAGVLALGVLLIARRISAPLLAINRAARQVAAGDEEVVRHLLRDILGTHGYEVLTAGDATEGLAIAARHQGPIDLVLSDVVLPGISGLTMIDRMAQVRPRAKVMLLSRYADDAIAGHGELDPTLRR